MWNTALNIVVRQDLFKEVVFELRSERYGDIWRKTSLGKGENKYKQLEVKWVWCV